MKSQSDYYDEENDLDEYCIVAHKNEADFTELKKQIVSNETLAKTIDKLGLFKYMYLGDTDLENSKFKNNLIKVKADLFETILGAVAIDSDWNQDELQNVVEFMLQIDDFLADVDTEEPRPSKFQLENAVTILKELAEKVDAPFLNTINQNKLSIYVEVESKPDGWSNSWNVSNRPVTWGT